MAKAPISGLAKTRLGQAIGFDAAARLYQAFLLDTLQTLQDGSGRGGEVISIVERRVTCPDSLHAAALEPIVGPRWPAIPQRRPGLMGAIRDTFDDGFAAGADIVVVIDADSPGLPYAHFEKCLRLTDNHAVVLGPTLDGGYYLLAARRDSEPHLTELLLGRPYDGATICVDTIRQAQVLGLSATAGPVGFDVDTLDDLRRLVHDLPRRPVSYLYHTRVALESIREIAGSLRNAR
jgi:glycosyltransferase A (GT-A) superfamily protein (DUF2064 family)